MSMGRGSGRIKVPTIMDRVGFQIIRISVGWLLATILGLGAAGLWTAIVLSKIIGG